MVKGEKEDEGEKITKLCTETYGKGKCGNKTKEGEDKLEGHPT